MNSAGPHGMSSKVKVTISSCSHTNMAVSGLFLNQEAIPKLIFLLKHWRKISNVYLNKNNSVYTRAGFNIQTSRKLTL